MNFSLYIFGTPKGRYSQFPNDYTASFLRSLQESFQGDSCLTVFRDHDLVRYAYVERLTEKECIGLCLILNKSQVTCPLKLKKTLRNSRGAVVGGNRSYSRICR